MIVVNTNPVSSEIPVKSKDPGYYFDVSVAMLNLTISELIQTISHAMVR